MSSGSSPVGSGISRRKSTKYGSGRIDDVTSGLMFSSTARTRWILNHCSSSGVINLKEKYRSKYVNYEGIFPNWTCPTSLHLLRPHPALWTPQNTGTDKNIPSFKRVITWNITYRKYWQRVSPWSILGTSESSSQLGFDLRTSASFFASPNRTKNPVKWV